MKKFMLMTGLLAVILVWVSCETDSTFDETSAAFKTTEQEGAVENFFQDASERIHFHFGKPGGKGGFGDCATISYAQEEGTYPNTMTITFDENCTDGHKDKVRSGSIVIDFSDDPANAGAVKTVNFADFFVDGNQVEGTKTLTNNGLNDSGQPSYTCTLTGGQITFADGTIATRESTRTKVQTSGADTDDRKDDSFEITGSGSGVNKDGEAYSFNITQALVKSMGCKWIASGIKEVVTGETQTILDYGDGTCDKYAELTENGETTTIELGRCGGKGHGKPHKD